MPLRVGVIVEGHGDNSSIPKLLERIWCEMFGEDFIEIRPFRQPQGILLKAEGLKKAVDAVKRRIGPDRPGDPRNLILILMDSEKKNCPRELAPKLLEWARESRSDADVACVLAYPMFETWFVAAASSLSGVNGLPENLAAPDDPEGKLLGKEWIKKQLARKYIERIDQPRFAAAMNLKECRERSASFDKLCRELEKRRQPIKPTDDA